jgi:hypothetical protein
MTRYLCFDISNILYRTFYAKRDEDDTTLAGLATHSALVTLNKYFNKFNPDRVVMAFDRSSWRKEYTASDKCVSKKPYKGNRRKDMSPAQQAKYQRFLNHVRELETLITDHTNIITLQADQMEADDMIAGFVQIYNDDDTEIIIISADSDYIQLKRYPGVRVVSPADDKEATLEDYNNDALLFLFIKCMRGDSSDNVQSARPNVSSVKLRKAYEDSFTYVSLMKERWEDTRLVNSVPTKMKFLVEDLYHENQLLIDLERQPPEIRIALFAAVEESVNKSRKFSLFHILKFIGKYQLNKIKDNIDQYLPLLSKT